MIANIAIGSNIGVPRSNVETAMNHIAQLGRLVAKSSLYATKPWGVVDQPDFCNAAMQIDTNLSPHELLLKLQGIERLMGRTATYKWGPRLIDLDILTADDLTIDDSILTVPHPHMNQRSFVLVPLAEIDTRFEAARDKLPATELSEVRLMESD